MQRMHLRASTHMHTYAPDTGPGGNGAFFLFFPVLSVFFSNLDEKRFFSSFCLIQYFSVPPVFCVFFATLSVSSLPPDEEMNTHTLAGQVRYSGLLLRKGDHYLRCVASATEYYLL